MIDLDITSSHRMVRKILNLRPHHTYQSYQPAGTPRIQHPTAPIPSRLHGFSPMFWDFSGQSWPFILALLWRALSWVSWVSWAVCHTSTPWHHDTSRNVRNVCSPCGLAALYWGSQAYCSCVLWTFFCLSWYSWCLCLVWIIGQLLVVLDGGCCRAWSPNPPLSLQEEVYACN